MYNTKDISQIREDLLGRSTVKRRKAAKKILTINSASFCQELRAALELEKDNNNWLTQVVLIRAIEKFECSDVINILSEFVYDFEEFSLVKKECARVFVKFKSKDLNDVCIIKDMLVECSYSAKEGALEALGYYKMKPSIDDLNQIIKLSKSIHLERPVGFTDPRYGLAAICADYKNEGVKDFLLSCVHSDDEPLKYVAQNSLNGVKSKLRKL